jgi:hypothetical protein
LSLVSGRRLRAAFLMSLSPMQRTRPNQSLEPTAGRCDVHI